MSSFHGVKMDPQELHIKSLQTLLLRERLTLSPLNNAINIAAKIFQEANPETTPVPPKKQFACQFQVSFK